MKTIENQTFDAERAFYGENEISVGGCKFDGPADGESAFKEASYVVAEKCYFNLRYPFWHNDHLVLSDSEMTENCRAALWYSASINITNTKMFGIKALRESRNIQIYDCEINSPEFGWFNQNIKMENTCAKSEYFMMRSEKLDFKKVRMEGKYSFQYITDSTFEDCVFTTKDAFWHAKNVTIKNCEITSEYIAWYSENVTFENCTIKGTQPFCYCKGLRLVNCKMIDADLSFEKSDVVATITNPIISIKNAASGRIEVPAVDEIIKDDPNAKAVIKVIL